MADKKVSELQKATQVNNSDLLMIVQNGQNKKIEFSQTKEKEIVLYNNETGTTGTVTLTETAANFEEIEIFYYKSGNYSSVKIANPNTKIANLTLNYYVSSEAMHFVHKEVLINAKSITVQHSGSMNITTSKTINTSSSNDNSIYIYKVTAHNRR